MSPKLRSISSKELMQFFETYVFEVICSRFDLKHICGILES